MLRNALLPVVTVAGMQAGALVGGAVVIETVFAWPGLGRLTFEAVLQRDYPVLLGIFLIMSIIVIALNLADRPDLPPDRSADDDGSRLMDAVRAFLRHPSGMAGLVLLTIVLIVAITAPLLFPVSPWEMSGTPFEPPARTGSGSAAIRSAAMSLRAWRMARGSRC